MDRFNVFKEFKFFLDKAKITNILMLGYVGLVHFLRDNLIKEYNYSFQIFKDIITSIEPIFNRIFNIHKNIQEELYSLIENDSIKELLEKQKIEVDICISHFEYDNAILPLLEEIENNNNISLTSELQRSHEKIYSEIEYIDDIIKKIENFEKESQYCYICFLMGIKNIALKKCKGCNKAICPQHDFHKGFCENCIKKRFDDMEPSV